MQIYNFGLMSTQMLVRFNIILLNLPEQILFIEGIWTCTRALQVERSWKQ